MDQGVGSVVRRLREERDWSMAKLAVEADMSVSGVSMIETGKRNLTTTTLAKLANALDVEVADLFPKKAQAPLPFEESAAASQTAAGRSGGADESVAAMWREVRALIDQGDKDEALSVILRRLLEAFPGARELEEMELQGFVQFVAQTEEFLRAFPSLRAALLSGEPWSMEKLLDHARAFGWAKTAGVVVDEEPIPGEIVGDVTTSLETQHARSVD